MKRSFFLLFTIILLSSGLEAKINISYAKIVLKKIPPQNQLFAKVIPQKIYKISSSINGRVSSFNINSGENIKKDSLIAKIKSNSISAKIRLLKKKIWQAKKDFDITKSILNILKNEYQKQLISKQLLLENKMKLEEIKTTLKSEKIKLNYLQKQQKLYSPITGKVINVSAANGDYIKSGETILTILPNKNRLLVTVYGKEGTNIKIGQKGWFYPQQYSSPILVKVYALIPNPHIPGTWNIYLNAVNKNPNWFAGEVGKFTFINKTAYLKAVPKKALIMDAGKLWVVKKTANGLKRIQVFIYTTNDKWAWIKGKNLNTGDEVIVSGAYQMFHKNFSKNYENPN